MLCIFSLFLILFIEVLSLGISLALLEAQDNEKLLVVALIDHFHNIISSNLVLSRFAITHWQKWIYCQALVFEFKYVICDGFFHIFTHFFNVRKSTFCSLLCWNKKVQNCIWIFIIHQEHIRYEHVILTL
jgi:hypothetical protein